MHGAVKGCVVGMWVPAGVWDSARGVSGAWQMDASRGLSLRSLQCVTTLRNRSGTVISATGTVAAAGEQTPGRRDGL